ncbi:MAG: prolipoprotein diacylglyceryl transferase [Planctomycetota bacterium]|nr:prolipoprotein diacylglyceryl transferase [Planctomycetota bacterium]
MHPILFEIPGLGFPVRSFGLMVALGFLLGSFLIGKLAARHSDDPEKDPQRFSNVTVWLVVGVIAGARLMYVLVEVLRGSRTGQSFRDDPLSILYVWQGGLVMYGGLIGAMAVGLWAAKREGLRPWRALDIGLVGGYCGQAIGRVGCLLVGDDYGKVVPEHLQWLPFPITLHVPAVLPHDSLFGMENAGKILWATQPLMSIKALIVAFIGWQVLKHRRYGGQAALWMLFSYGVLRFSVELLRGDAVRGVWFGGAISTSQIVSIVLTSVCGGLLLKFRGRRDAPPATAAG